jgi:two-component system sensor histidine kinase YesM
MGTIKLKKNMEVELQDRLLLLQNAQLGALQSQINPHFLFNTLDTINWITIETTGGNNNASSAITTLSELFRLSLDITSYLVSIETEIEHAKLYIKLIDMRYHNKVTVNWDFEQDILYYMVPKLCLQPMIENAVYHGIKPKMTAGLIVIKGRAVGNDILIEISDDGIGINEKKVLELNEMLEQNYINGDKHIGLRNVNQRIKLIFGESYGIKISSTENKGSIFTITIPKKL